MKTLLIMIICYIAGYVAMYYAQKLDNHVTGIENSWKEVNDRAQIALLSWIGILLYIIAFCIVFPCQNISEYIKSKQSEKPPKWL